VREVELLENAQVTILADRRKTQPWGLAGGEPGAPGITAIIRDGVERTLPGKSTIELPAGTRIRIESPGGGGWGKS
jgi:N-methylhydantoinase B